MVNSLNIAFKFLLLGSIVVCFNSCNSVSSQSEHLREIKIQQESKQAPQECLDEFHKFFEYVKSSKTNIADDENAQNLWLSENFRKAFIEAIKRAGKPDQNPDYPSNEDFIGVWNYPTTYSIVDSRYYETSTQAYPINKLAIIDVLYEWDGEASMENQYPNDKRLFSFIFIFEDNKWKLDDMYSFDANESLYTYYKNMPVN